MNDQFLNDNGTPNLPELIAGFGRSAPNVAAGTAWMDNIRFNRWPNQWSDGKKHDVQNNPNGQAFPFDGASDVRPMLVDDIINERAAMKTTAFWNAQLAGGSADGEDDAATYAVALVQHLVFDVLYYDLCREVELSAQYEEHYGWMALAPRWQRKLGVKTNKLLLQNLEVAAQQETAAQAQAQAQQGLPQTPQQPTGGPLQNFVDAVKDPMREDEAVAFAQQWYNDYIEDQLPEDMRGTAPKVTLAQARRAVQGLRVSGEADVMLPYLAKNQPTIAALKPYDEVFIPAEITTDNEIVYQVERVHEVELRSRIRTQGYDAAWVDEAVKFKGQIASSAMEVRTQPVGVTGLTGNGASVMPILTSQPALRTSLIQIVHAIYHGINADGIPAVYCTTFHTQVPNLYGLHEVVEDAAGSLPYAAGVREWWCRSITSSRGVPERAHTQQNLVKGILDSLIDRTSITVMPPINVYESPLGTPYKFGPAKQNYVKLGREPRFLEGLSGEGVNEAAETLTVVRGMVDNSFGLMSPDVGPGRLQMSQGMAVRRFLMTWYKALQQVLNLYLLHGDDAEFSQITGAPQGWLEAHREDTGCLVCGLHFDVRELDPDLMLKRIETMNSVVLPNDVLGVVDRGEWAGLMVRAIMGPMAARRLVMSKPDASSALRKKTEDAVLKMFAGNQPELLDQDDPTAASMLQFTQDNVTSNQNYLAALSDDALTELAGDQAPMLAQRVGQRKPDPLFSQNLVQWLKNLKFIGVTQQQNKQRGREGV